MQSMYEVPHGIFKIIKSDGLKDSPERKVKAWISIL